MEIADKNIQCLRILSQLTEEMIKAAEIKYSIKSTKTGRTHIIICKYDKPK